MMASSDSSREEVQQPTPSNLTVAPLNTRSSTHTSTIRLPQSSFARSFSRPLAPNSTGSTLRPPFASDANRGSVTSIYSQASTAERPSSITPISIRKQPFRTPPTNHARDLTSVDEEDPLITPRYEGLSTNDAIQKRREYEQQNLVTPRPSTPEDDYKPLVSPITRTNSQWSRSAVSPEHSTRTTKIYRSDTIGALTKAISASVQDPVTPASKPPQKTYDAPRMPFHGSPSSSDGGVKSSSQRDDMDDMATIPLVDSKGSPDNANSHEGSPVATRSMSTHSTNPLLESPLEQSTSMRDRIPVHKRPANLNLNAVKVAESRGSLTSLPDLIQRATRLASNLDRGKTASRLGLDNMFSSSEKPTVKKRESTYSDVLFSFPAPGSTTPTSLSHEQRSITKTADGKEVARANSRLMELKDVDEEQDHEEEKEERRERRRRRKSKRRRRCCGMPLSVFIVLLVLFILLVAVAVLLPVFLILLPRQHAANKNSSQCAATLACHNGGISIVDDNSCSCICVDGYTGSQCTSAGDPSCSSTQVQDGASTYDHATVGNNLVGILAAASSTYSIALNTTAILSTFARNNLSCSSENSLISFNNLSLNKRLFMIPNLEPQQPPPLPLPTRVVQGFITKRTPDDPPVETKDSIIYAATTTAAATATSTGIVTATPSSTSGSAAPSSTVKASAQQIEFAQVVVLYVLQQLRTTALAVNSQSYLAQYLRNGGPASGNSTINVVPFQNSGIFANFANFSISNADGTVVGGKASAT